MPRFSSQQTDSGRPIYSAASEEHRVNHRHASWAVRYAHGVGVGLHVDGDEQVIEAAAQRAGHVLGADGVQQLLVIHVVAQDVRAPVVGLEAHGAVQLQRVRVETGGRVAREVRWLDEADIGSGRTRQFRLLILSFH